MTFGSEQFGPEPFVQPGPLTMPAAFDQPPAYHAQSIPLAVSRSPIVAFVSSGSFAPNEPDGACDGCIVFTAKSPHARFNGAGHAAAMGPRCTGPVGVYSGYFTGIPFESRIVRRFAGGFAYVGVAAAISHWWLRNDPPNAA